MKLIKLPLLGLLAASAALFSFSEAKAAPLSGWLDCFHGGPIYECTAVVSGGTPPYSYSWVGTSAPAPGETGIYLCLSGSRTFNVTVTDAVSASIALTETGVCGN